MEEQIALFLTRFNKLKKEVNNSPKTLSWLATEKEDIQDLCFELEGNFQTIAKFLATKNNKHTFITVPFENDLKEYESNYQKHVLTAAEPIREREEKKLKELLKKIELDTEMSKEEFNKWLAGLIAPGSSFDPFSDDPAFLMEEIKYFIHDMIANDDPDNEFFDKAYGAWYFYEKSIGLDLEGIYRRWKNSPELFIPIQIQATTNTTPLIELYNEAVKSFAFGNKVAAMTLCRPLMEYILKKYYVVKDEKLGKIVALAEERFPNLQKLSMRSKKEKADDILHNYEKKSNTEDKSVIEFLKTIKYLVQHIPTKRK